MSKRATGATISMTRAATARVLTCRASFSKTTAVRKTKAMITARCVEGDIPTSMPYTMTGKIVKAADHLITTPARSNRSDLFSAIRKRKKKKAPTIPT